MLPTKTVTFDRLEGEVAVLRTDDGQELVWPRTELPNNVKQGDVLSLALLSNADLTKERTHMAKTMLNEILGSSNEKA